MTTRLGLALALLGSLLLTGCGNPCAKLPPGTEEQKRIVADGFELEQEKGSTDCVLQRDGSWKRD